MAKSLLPSGPRITNRAGRDRPRFIRPVERQRMRPWLEEHLDNNDIPGLIWVDKTEMVFKIAWKHAANQCFNLQKDTNLFERWAIHTGRHYQGDHKRWKANFRCALNSLPDVKENKEQGIKKGNNAFKVYRFLDEKDTKAMKEPKVRKKPVFPSEADLRAKADADGYIYTEQGLTLKVEDKVCSNIPILPKLEQLYPTSGVEMLIQAGSDEKVEALTDTAEDTNLQEILAAATASLAAGSDPATLENISINQLKHLGDVSRMKLDVRQGVKKNAPGYLYVFLCRWCEKVFSRKIELFQHFLVTHQDKLMAGEEYGDQMTEENSADPKHQKLLEEIQDLEQKVLGFSEQPYQSSEGGSEDILDDQIAANEVIATGSETEEKALDLTIPSKSGKQAWQDTALDLSMSTGRKGKHQKHKQGKQVVKRRRSSQESDLSYSVKFGNYGIVGTPRTKRQMSLHIRKKEEEQERLAKKVMSTDGTDPSRQHSIEDIVHAEMLLSLKTGNEDGNDNDVSKSPVKKDGNKKGKKGKMAVKRSVKEVKSEATDTDVSPIKDDESESDMEVDSINDSGHGTNVKAYKCGLCFNKFSTSALLSKHVESHAGSFVQLCKSCGKEFQSQEELLKHIASSHSFLFYKCNFCSKVCRTVKKLKNHMWSHISKCVICGEKFYNADLLDMHLKDVHGVDPETIVQDPEDETSDDSENEDNNKRDGNGFIDYDKGGNAPPEQNDEPENDPDQRNGTDKPPGPSGDASNIPDGNTDKEGNTEKYVNDCNAIRERRHKDSDISSCNGIEENNENDDDNESKENDEKGDSNDKGNNNKNGKGNGNGDNNGNGNEEKKGNGNGNEDNNKNGDGNFNNGNGNGNKGNRDRDNGNGKRNGNNDNNGNGNGKENNDKKENSNKDEDENGDVNGKNGESGVKETDKNDHGNITDSENTDHKIEEEASSIDPYSFLNITSDKRVSSETPGDISCQTTEFEANEQNKDKYPEQPTIEMEVDEIGDYSLPNDEISTQYTAGIDIQVVREETCQSSPQENVIIQNLEKGNKADQDNRKSSYDLTSKNKLAETMNDNTVKVTGFVKDEPIDISSAMEKAVLLKQKMGSSEDGLCLICDCSVPMKTLVDHIKQHSVVSLAQVKDALDLLDIKIKAIEKPLYMCNLCNVGLDSIQALSLHVSKHLAPVKLEPSTPKVMVPRGKRKSKLGNEGSKTKIRKMKLPKLHGEKEIAGPLVAVKDEPDKPIKREQSSSCSVLAAYLNAGPMYQSITVTKALQQHLQRKDKTVTPGTSGLKTGVKAIPPLDGECQNEMNKQEEKSNELSKNNSDDRKDKTIAESLLEGIWNNSLKANPTPKMISVNETGDIPTNEKPAFSVMFLKGSSRNDLDKLDSPSAVTTQTAEPSKEKRDFRIMSRGKRGKARTTVRNMLGLHKMVSAADVKTVSHLVASTAVQPSMTTESSVSNKNNADNSVEKVSNHLVEETTTASMFEIDSNIVADAASTPETVNQLGNENQVSSSGRVTLENILKIGSDQGHPNVPQPVFLIGNKSLMDSLRQNDLQKSEDLNKMSLPLILTSLTTKSETGMVPSVESKNIESVKTNPTNNLKLVGFDINVLSSKGKETPSPNFGPIPAKILQLSLPNTAQHISVPYMSTIQGLMSPKSSIQGSLNVTSSIPVSIPVTSKVLGSLPVETSIRGSLPITSAIQRSLNVTSTIPVSLPITSANQGSLSFTSSTPGSLPIISAIQGSLPTIPIQGCLPITFSQRAPLPVTSSSSPGSLDFISLYRTPPLTQSQTLPLTQSQTPPLTQSQTSTIPINSIKGSLTGNSAGSLPSTSFPQESFPITSVKGSLPSDSGGPLPSISPTQASFPITSLRGSLTASAPQQIFLPITSLQRTLPITPMQQGIFPTTSTPQGSVSITASHVSSTTISSLSSSSVQAQNQPISLNPATLQTLQLLSGTQKSIQKQVTVLKLANMDLLRNQNALKIVNKNQSPAKVTTNSSTVLSCPLLLTKDGAGLSTPRLVQTSFPPLPGQVKKQVILPVINTTSSPLVFIKDSVALSSTGIVKSQTVQSPIPSYDVVGDKMVNDAGDINKSINVLNFALQGKSPLVSNALVSSSPSISVPIVSSPTLTQENTGSILSGVEQSKGLLNDKLLQLPLTQGSTMVTSSAGNVQALTSSTALVVSSLHDQTKKPTFNLVLTQASTTQGMSCTSLASSIFSQITGGQVPKSISAIVPHEKKMGEMISEETLSGSGIKQIPNPVQNRLALICSLCKVEIQSLEMITKHICSGIPTVVPSVDNEIVHKVPRRKAIFTCVACQMDIDEYEIILSHLREHYGDNPECGRCCKFCLLSCDTHEQYGNHMKDYHGNRIFPCPLCSKDFPDKKSSVEHIQDEHSTKTRCETCNDDKIYLNPSELTLHRIFQHPFKCIICEYRCDTWSTILIHVLNHTAIKGLDTASSNKTPERNGIMCKKCLVGFPSMIAFKSHARVSHRRESIESLKGEKLEMCHLCSFTYSKKERFHKHICSVHVRELSYKCGLCEKNCSNPTTFILHLKEHLNQGLLEIEFCHLCQKVFPRKLLHQQHMLYHASLGSLSSFQTNEVVTPTPIISKEEPPAKRNELTEAEQGSDSTLSGDEIPTDTITSEFDEGAHICKSDKMKEDSPKDVGKNGLKCGICGVGGFKSSFQLKQHRVIRHIHPQTRSSPSYYQHVIDNIKKPRYYDCKICGQKLESKIKLRKHLTMHIKTTSGEFVCSNYGCSLKFKARLACLNHINVCKVMKNRYGGEELEESEEERIECVKPRKKSEFVSRFVWGPNLLCKLCSIMFDNRIDLKRHLMQVHSERVRKREKIEKSDDFISQRVMEDQDLLCKETISFMD